MRGPETTSQEGRAIKAKELEKKMGGGSYGRKAAARKTETADPGDKSRGLPLASILIAGIPLTLLQEGTGDRGRFHPSVGGGYLSTSDDDARTCSKLKPFPCWFTQMRYVDDPACMGGGDR
ncbi:hypothetical protein KSP40_PGU014136 [Platanthera guangdongensis]|uniref:Uncharacterized protein n=1 Tax=Platanthera guangdongensis TaxID=2320717 RepID=A0ABR2N1G8_9ASPA